MVDRVGAGFLRNVVQAEAVLLRLPLFVGVLELGVDGSVGALHLPRGDDVLVAVGVLDAKGVALGIEGEDLALELLAAAGFAAELVFVPEGDAVAYLRFREVL